MDTREELGASVAFKSLQLGEGTALERESHVAVEVPVTIVANDIEVATLSCTPCELPEFVQGFLYTSGFISSAEDVQDYYCDPRTWRVDVKLSRDLDPEFHRARLYTSGCGKGVMYTNVAEIAIRHPIQNAFTVGLEHLRGAMKWLQQSSELHRLTGGVHSAALSTADGLPTRAFDDIGRHNAVDKAIGNGLRHQADFTRQMLICTGRISSEILFKARRAGVPFVTSLSAPTHQAVLLARSMRMTLVGFARGRTVTIFSETQRIVE